MAGAFTARTSHFLWPTTPRHTKPPQSRRPTLAAAIHSRRLPLLPQVHRRQHLRYPLPRVPVSVQRGTRVALPRLAQDRFLDGLAVVRHVRHVLGALSALLAAADIDRRQ